MPKEYLAIKKRLHSGAFNDFYKKNFENSLNYLERKRKNRLRDVTLLGILVALLFFIWILFAPYIDNEDLRNIVLVVPLLVTILTIIIIINKYNVEVKKTIFNKLLSFIGNFKYVDSTQYSTNDRAYIESLNLFDKFNIYRKDDRFKGEYNNLSVDIMEIYLAKQTRYGKKRHVRTIFKGIFIVVPCLKKYESSTIIKANSIKIGNNKNRIKLEDPEFEKIYDVYSDDQIEARYLITPSLMERLVQLNNKGKKIILSFENGNINIGIPSNENWFEFPIYKTLYDEKQYKTIIKQFIVILSIIDSLKLYQNIGL